MENLRFKCSACNKYVETNKEVIGSFVNWGYYNCVEWSNFADDVPDLSEQNWIGSERTPIANELRTVRVRKPFDEKIGNEFFTLYEPAPLFFNGWNNATKEELQNCAVVKCKFEKILASDEYRAWISVSIKKVLPLHTLCNYYENTVTNAPIDKFEDISESKCDRVFQNDEWLIMAWDAEGDCGESKWIYTDECGVRHLVMQMYFDFHEDIIYLGNVTNSK
ncbi:MAG: hypothetical protein NC240_11635 [Clostridium sp.]|nr:hypothetical protein [Clostridium sp.]